METYVVLDTVDTVLDRLLLALDHTNTRQTIEGVMRDTSIEARLQ